MHPLIESPYGVPAASVVHPVSCSKGDALLHFERDQVQRMIAQLDNSPIRVRNAVLKHIRANRYKYRT